MTTSQEAAAGRNAQTAQKVCYRFMIILCLNGTEGLLLLYTSRQNKRLYYLQMSGLKNPLKLTTCTFCLPALTCRYAPQHLLEGMLFSPDVAGLVSTECDRVQSGVSRTFPAPGFPAQEQLFARHLANHDCANAARPPQPSLSSGTVLTAHAGDSPAKSCLRSWHGQPWSLWQFPSDALGCCGDTKRWGDRPAFLFFNLEADVLQNS